METQTQETAKPDTPGRTAMSEWGKLTSETSQMPRGDRRAILARLRRAHTPADALMEEWPWRLKARLVKLFPWFVGDDVNRKVGAVACVLAHIKDHTSRHPMSGGKEAMTKSRFVRLMRVPDDDLDTLVALLRRLVKAAGGTASVYAVADAILHWNERTREQWTAEYHGAAARETDDSEEGDE